LTDFSTQHSRILLISSHGYTGSIRRRRLRVEVRGFPVLSSGQKRRSVQIASLGYAKFHKFDL